MPRGGRRPGAGRKKQKLGDTASVSEIVSAVPSDALEQVLRELPEDVTAHELLRAVVRSPKIPAPIRMHAAAKVLPYEVAKPTTTIKDGPAEPSIHDGARDKLRNKLDRLSGPGTASEASGKPH